MSKRVLHITGAMNMGGAEVMLMDLLRFKSSSFHFDFLINHKKNTKIEDGDFDSEIKKLGSKLYYIPVQWDIGPLAYARRFKEVCSKSQPDIIHIHMNAKSGVIAWAAQKAGVTKVIVHSHADLKIRGHWLKVALSKIELAVQKRFIAKYASHYWGCSVEANRSLFLPRLLSSDKSAVINNAIDAEKFCNPNSDEVAKLKRSYGFSASTIIIGNVGRVVSHKNIKFILSILLELQNTTNEYAFVFAGRGSDEIYLDSFWQEAHNLGLENRIIHLGVRDDVEVVMSTFDVFVGPALQEGFGLVAVEAQAAGLPTILYKGFPQSVDMNLGLVSFLNSFSVDSWVECIFNALSKQPNGDVLSKIQEQGLDVRTNTAVIEKLYSTI